MNGNPVHTKVFVDEFFWLRVEVRWKRSRKFLLSSLSDFII